MGKGCVQQHLYDGSRLEEGHGAGALRTDLEAFMLDKISECQKAISPHSLQRPGEGLIEQGASSGPT